MLLRFKKFRFIFVSLFIVFIGSYTYVIKWSHVHQMAWNAGSAYRDDDEVQEEFLPQAKTTNHTQVFCSPWKPNDLEYPSEKSASSERAAWRGLREVTSPVYSSIHIINYKTSYNICDKITASITVRNWRNKIKLYGGDYIRATIYSETPPSSANADYLFDYGNGSYMAYFTVRWPAIDVKIQATLVHPREGVDVLRRLQRVVPDRFVYTGRFSIRGNNNLGENVPCHVSQPMRIPACNLSDTRTFAPWYCARPSKYNLTCADFTWHRANNVGANEEAGNLVTESEGWLFYQQKRRISRYFYQFNVLYRLSNNPDSVVQSSGNTSDLPFCTFGQVPPDFNTSGYFVKETWFPYNCKVHPFTVTETLQCLRNKSLYFYGDSTVRQLYEFFLDRCRKTLKSEHIRPSKFWKVGPLKSRDQFNNITMEYRHHGLPIRNNWTWIRDIHYVANEIDSLKGGDDVIVTLSLWAHFTATPFSFYEQRLRGIKGALNRLWDRAPGTTVVIKGANTRGHDGLSYALYTSDWFAYHLEQILRDVFRSDKRIGYLDVWDMSTADPHPDVIHPPPYFIANVVNRFLTYVCKR